MMMMAGLVQGPSIVCLASVVVASMEFCRALVPYALCLLLTVLQPASAIIGFGAFGYGGPLMHMHPHYGYGHYGYGHLGYGHGMYGYGGMGPGLGYGLGYGYGHGYGHGSIGLMGHGHYGYFNYFKK